MKVVDDVVHESVAAYGAQPRRWNVVEYYLAAEKGLFGDDEKLELLRGEVVKMSPQGGPHAWLTAFLRDALREVFPDAFIRDHSPLSVDDLNEPEPDILVAAGPASTYIKRHPNPNEVLLVVEISDSSLRKDRTLKGPIYAEFGIPEYWILDLKGRRLEIYREPSTDPAGKGVYSVSELFEPGGKAKPLKGVGEIDVASLFPL